MITATAVASILAFLAAFAILGVKRVAGETLATTRYALTEFAERRLDDDALERAARQASLRLFAGSASLALRGAGALLLAGLPIVLADFAGLVPGSEVVAFLSTWQVLGLMTALLLAAYLLARSGWRST